MRPSQALERHRAAIRHIVEQNRAHNPRVFGSAIHGSDTEGSDLDLLVDTDDETSLMDLARIQVAAEELLGVPVDVATSRSLPAKLKNRLLHEAVSL